MRKYIDGKIYNLSQIEIDDIPVFVRESGDSCGCFNIDNFGNRVKNQETTYKECDSNWDNYGNPIYLDSKGEHKLKKSAKTTELGKLSYF